MTFELDAKSVSGLTDVCLYVFCLMKTEKHQLQWYFSSHKIGFTMEEKGEEEQWKVCI